MLKSNTEEKIMFIQTETTPNPATLKFIPGETVLDKGTAQFSKREDAKRSPLAAALFEVIGVESVFLGSDFISVTKSATSQWDLIKAEVLTTIMEHYVSGAPMLKENTADTEDANVNQDEDAIVTQIKELIETRVRPAVAQDGGDIIFRGFKDGVVQLELHGACSGCPSSTITLKNGIENMLKHYVPEVESVESVR
jgi:Fe-S cluster biogenesis protein NfuA